MTTWGSRSSGSPTTSTSGTRRGRLPHPVDELARGALLVAPPRQRSVATPRPRPARAGTQGAACSRPCSASRRGPGRPQRVPVRTASSPSGGPPNDAASATTTDPGAPAGRPSRPRDAVASSRSGTPRSRQSASTSATGWRVPTSPLAVCSTRGGDVGAAERDGIRGGVDPPGRVDGDGLLGAGLEEQHRALGGTGDDARTGAPAGVAQPGEPQLEGRLGARRAATARRGARPGRSRGPPGRCRAGRAPGGPVGAAGWGRPSRWPGRPPSVRAATGCSGPRAASSSPVTCGSRGVRATLRP